MKKILERTIVQPVMMITTTVIVVLPQTISPVGKFVYKTYLGYSIIDQ